ncbi:hypothetical protein [Pseudomonas sp. TTU2014-080ASC]|uniref:hypothetical protein n=1 Tax=Pseudomonas sp. TTU2014-080ASC TaxID=1729724 RepID=UPI0007183DCD|nr:hypothetical protein [Pseudomonas sp. TTU2014-080ASC]KRW61326.1 hypothetical protein AO726_08350 [Pseudomonas sp. TTU2014-080ASC]
MKKQLGQSMTEYLVVLGVTGAALLAATTDVTELFGNVQDSYRIQSSEMNKVQIYGSPKFQTGTPTRDEGDGDDGDDTPEVPVNNPVADYPPVITTVFDSTGQAVGTLDRNDKLVDENGKEIAWCRRKTEGPDVGQCEFVDLETNEVIPGYTTGSEWADDQGNPLQLHALSRNGAVVGFAYFYNDNYYDAVSRKRLDPQPTNLTGVATRPVISLDENGKPFISGREASGYIYSEGSVQESTQDFSQTKKIEGELVTLEYENPQLPISEPNKYKPCVVTKNNWSTGTTSGMLNTFGFGDQLFLNPSSYVDSSSADCNGGKTVRRLANGDWQIL